VIHQVFAIFDSKVQAFATPWFSRSESEALRAVTAAMDDAQSLLAKFPEDYSVHHLGSFDDETGILEQKLPVNLGLVAVFKRKEI